MEKKTKELKGTFMLNKGEPIHRWYPYIEGYSSIFVKHELDQIGSVYSVYDPFGGCGTTPLTAAQMGIVSHYSETNPFMAQMCKVKTKIAYEASRDLNNTRELIKVLLEAIEKESNDMGITDYDGFEKYYDQLVLNEILRIKGKIQQTITDNGVRELAMAGLASILIRVSNTIRRGDLRFALADEKHETDKNVKVQFTDKMKEIMEDISDIRNIIQAPVIKLSEDARDVVYSNIVDCIITSPPYLNGTNYIRNTKLELKLCDYIKREEDLSRMHSMGIIAGINNVSKRNAERIRSIKQVDEILERLMPITYDKRIPDMISGYFSGMEQVIAKLHNVLVDRGYFIMDIGDSQFSGVHVPTHEVLISIAEDYGFRNYSNEVLRTRVSKNGMKLTQRILRFRLNK